MCKRTASAQPQQSGCATDSIRALTSYTPSVAIRFVLNGKAVQVDELDPHVSLLGWLRSKGYTGAKEGCAEGECGACAVARLSQDVLGRTRWEAINSCIVPLAAVHGQSITTVEGVADENGTLHPVQRALIDHGASQCGYCTPGFVMSLFCEYYRPGRTDYDPEGISGNLCRCTGYRPIVDAARSLTLPDRSDQRLQLLEVEPPPLTPFEHTANGHRILRPRDLSRVLELMGECPDAVLVAGGTDLMPLLNQRRIQYATVILLEGVPELGQFAVREQEIVIGAGLCLSKISEKLAVHAIAVPALEQLFPLFSSRLIRNQATLGGNLATASPIGDAIPVLLALDAEVSLASPRGRRRLAVSEFLVDYRKTALGPAELIVAVHLPRPLAQLQRFYKVSKRVLDDISTVSGAFALDLTADGRVERLRIAYGGVGPTALRARSAEQQSLGLPWSEATLPSIAAEVENSSSPLSDHRGSAAYRGAMTRALLEKFFYETRRTEAEGGHSMRSDA
jgi:xanthine dehydrogenase small subunit